MMKTTFKKSIVFTTEEFVFTIMKSSTINHYVLMEETAYNEASAEILTAQQIQQKLKERDIDISIEELNILNITEKVNITDIYNYVEKELVVDIPELNIGWKLKQKLVDLIVFSRIDYKNKSIEFWKQTMEILNKQQ